MFYHALRVMTAQFLMPQYADSFMCFTDTVAVKVFADDRREKLEVLC